MLDASITASDVVGELTSIRETSAMRLTLSAVDKTQGCENWLESSLLVKSIRGSDGRRIPFAAGGAAPMETVEEIEGCGRLELKPLSGTYHPLKSVRGSWTPAEGVTNTWISKGRKATGISEALERLVGVSRSSETPLRDFTVA